MKRLLSILSAGVLALMAFSCTEEELATFDQSKIDAPILGSYDLTEEVLTVNFTPAVSSHDFNKNVPLNYALAFVSVDGKEVSKVIPATKVNGNVMTLTVNNLIKALAAYGYAPGDNANFELVVRATTQDLSKDTGINGYVDSEGHIKFVNYTLTEYVKPQQEDPYAGMTEASKWSVIGKIASTGNEWGNDEPMLTDGEWHLCRGIVLSTADEFKFRFDGGWDTNFGLEGSDPVVVTLDEELTAVAGGANIKVPEDGTYDLLLNPESELIKVVQAVAAPDPYEQYSEDSTWSLIGAMSLYGYNWGDDIDMKTDGDEHIAIEVNLAAGDEVKFRNNHGWDENFGYAEGISSYELGEEIPVAQGGANIIIAETGVYNLFLLPDDAVARIEFVKEYSGDTPEPQEPDVNGVWTLVGDINGWAVDAGLASEDYGTWKLVQNVTIGTHDDNGTTVVDAVKWVMDGGWDVNFGFVKGEAFAGLDVEQDAAFGGDNIVVAEPGVYDFYLDPKAKKVMVKLHSDEPLPEIYPYTVVGWFGSAEGDVSWDLAKGIEMTKADGDWYVAAGVPAASNGKIDFKFVHNKSWDDEELGAAFTQAKNVGEVFTLAAKGANNNIVLLGEGSYDIYLNKELKKAFILVAGTTFAVPETEETIDTSVSEWSVVGTINGWDKDASVEMVTMEGWEIAKGVALTTDDQIKFIKNHAWAPMYASLQGGANAANEKILLQYRATEADTDPSAIMAKDAGTYDIYLNTTEKIAYLIEAGATFTFWNEKWEEPEPPSEFVKVYIDNQTGLDAINIWAWDGFGSIVEGLNWPGLTLTDKEEVSGKSWYVVSVNSAKVKGQKCSFLITNPEGNWQTADYSFTADDTSLAYFFTVTTEGITPADVTLPTKSAWMICGGFTGWNPSNAISMVVEEGWEIARNVEIPENGEFKFIADPSWKPQFGLAEEATFEAGAEIALIRKDTDADTEPKNIKIGTAGTYDVFLNVDKKVAYVMTPGSPIPSGGTGTSIIARYLGR